MWTSCSQDVDFESHDQHPETVENSQSDLDMSRSMITTTSTQVSVENQDVHAGFSDSTEFDSSGN